MTDIDDLVLRIRQCEIDGSHDFADLTEDALVALDELAAHALLTADMAQFAEYVQLSEDGHISDEGLRMATALLDRFEALNTRAAL